VRVYCFEEIADFAADISVFAPLDVLEARQQPVCETRSIEKKMK
jgi:hypothetical protein